MKWRVLTLSALFSVACVERAGPSDAQGGLGQYVLDAPPAAIANRTDVTFASKVKLVGYRLDPDTVAPGREIKVTFYWQTLDVLGEGWQSFTHLVDEKGARVSNLDGVGPLRNASSGKPALPPSEWQRGKVYVDEQTFTIPADAPGDLSLLTGFWKGAERLPITTGTGDAEGRAAVIKLGAKTAAPAPPKKKAVPELFVNKLEVAAPKIDGVLDDPAWQTAATTGPLIDVASGGPNTRLAWNGSVKLTWDDKNLYVAAEVKDTKLVGGFSPTDTKDPHLWEKECVELMIEPDAEGTNAGYYEIQIGTQNLIFDSQFDGYNSPRGGPNGPFGHEEWAIRGVTAVKVDGTLDKDDDTDVGYVVEASIPWTSFSRALRAPPAPGDAWRMNFYAMKRNDGVAWSPILGEGNFHKASRFGRVVFVAPKSANAAPSASASGKPAASGKPR
jgi:hypothetical protein